MLDRLDKTIAAIASAPGPGLRGIIRVSGHKLRSLIERAITLDDPVAFIAASRAGRYTGTVLIGNDGSLTVPVSVLYWPNARSYTGELMAELHLVGSPPLLDAVLSRLSEQGAIPSATGEFTLRAFLNRRIDLMQAEAVLGVIDATDQQLLEQALSQLAGGLSGQIALLREQLLLDLADLEAGLDFVDEDIEFVQREEMIRRLQSGAEFVDRLRTQADARLQTQVRRRVLLAGLPNAGKSSLFNKLLESDQALVSTIPGTTRDYLTANVEWQGLPIELVDTAGWEADAIGPLAQGLLAREDQWRRSCLILWCSACNQSPRDTELDEELFTNAIRSATKVLRVRTKSDLIRSGATGGHELESSILDRASLEAVRIGVVNQLIESQHGGGEMLASTGSRCLECLNSASRALQQARRLAVSESDDTLIAMELRAALEELGTITGQTYTDDILDRIFSRFCIGK